jgi:hypothetical protein
MTAQAAKTLHYNRLDTITVRLLEVMQRHSNYFMSLLCYYYPFTKKMLRKYQKQLLWNCLSENYFLDWDEKLLIEFKDKWDWWEIGRNILGWKGKLANFNLLLKYYKRGLIDAEIILLNQIENAYYNYDRAFSTLDSFYEEFEDIYQLVSKNDELREEMEELVLERIKKNDEAKILNNYSESRSKTPEKIGNILNNMGSELKYIIYQNQVKELEQIISFLEKEGKILDVGYISRQLAILEKPDPFFCDNPLKIGFSYTFNTPEKRKILDDAVEVFLIEQTKYNQ